MPRQSLSPTLRRILNDGRWHRRDELVERLRPLMRPEAAYRLAYGDRLHPERASQEEILEAGFRKLLTQTIRNLRLTGSLIEAQGPKETRLYRLLRQPREGRINPACHECGRERHPYETGWLTATPVGADGHEEEFRLRYFCSAEHLSAFFARQSEAAKVPVPS